MKVKETRLAKRLRQLRQKRLIATEEEVKEFKEAVEERIPVAPSCTWNMKGRPIMCYGIPVVDTEGKPYVWEEEDEPKDKATASKAEQAEFDKLPKGECKPVICGACNQPTDSCKCSPADRMYADVDRFHDHLAFCNQCSDHPFHLCPTGVGLLEGHIADTVSRHLAEGITEDIVSGKLCGCGCCHKPDYGACQSFEKGANGRCVYCDHGKVCHPGDPKSYNTPI